MYSSKTSAEMVSPQPPPQTGRGDAWLDAIAYAKSFEFIPSLVVEDMVARRAFGVAKYATPLQLDNGRDNGIDAYQEDLDKFVYFTCCVQDPRYTDEQRQLFRMLRNNCLVELSLLRLL